MFQIDTCDLGHKFAVLSDHPRKDGLARCPHCMAIGIDQARDDLNTVVELSEIADWRFSAYAKLGMVRDKMPPEHVRIVQDFLEPLKE